METYDPSLFTYSWPLEVGKSWSGRFNGTVKGETLTTYVEVKVDGMETFKLRGSEIPVFHITERRTNMRGMLVMEYTQLFSPTFKRPVYWLDERQAIGAAAEGRLLDYKQVPK